MSQQFITWDDVLIDARREERRFVYKLRRFTKRISRFLFSSYRRRLDVHLIGRLSGEPSVNHQRVYVLLRLCRCDGKSRKVIVQLATETERLRVKRVSEIPREYNRGLVYTCFRPRKTGRLVDLFL